MSAVPVLPSCRRVAYLLGGGALAPVTPLPRRATPALFLPVTRTDWPLAAVDVAH